MLDIDSEIADALAGTLLGGRAVVEIPMVGADQLAFAVECGPGEIVPAWQAARSALPATGRWPLVMSHWEQFSGPRWPARLAAARMESLRHLAEMRYATGDHTLGRADDAVTVPTVAAALAPRLAEMGGEPADVEAARRATARHFGARPTAAEVVAAVGDDPDELALERWLFDWEAGRTPTTPLPTRHLDRRFRGEHPAVLLLPVTHGWDTFAYVDRPPGGGALGGTGRLIALVRSWQERFSAELVANWGTGLEFTVRRPPGTAADAWQLAVEHVAAAPGTTRTAGIALRHHAWLLVGRPAWFLDQSTSAEGSDNSARHGWSRWS